MMRISIILATCLLASATMAQDLVGKALVDGREVELFSDQTWRFAGEAIADCRTLSTKVEFCGDKGTWEDSVKPNADILASFRYNATTYGQYVVEDIGAAQGLTLPAVKQFVLDYAGQLSGEPPIVISTEPVTLGGLTGETVVYAFAISGLNTVYSNSMLLGENTLLQVMTYELGKEFTPEHAAIHAEFLAATKVTE
jgi:hypothetical protein